MTARFDTGYMDEALFDLQKVIREAMVNLEPVKHEFDTLVGTGFSGGVVIPALAMRLRKKFVLVRKDADDSHHSGRLIGELGARWIFVDDFVSSGATKRRVVEKINVAATERAHPTTLVGSYLYAERIEFKYVPEADYDLGYL